MKLIGRIADGSTETKARVILMKEKEFEISSEEIVIIKNGDREDQQILGVLREGLGKNEFLSHTSYKPDVAYMKYGGEPSGSREVYSFLIQPIGLITTNGLEPNKKVIQPRSPVYLCEDADNPFSLITKNIGSELIWLNAYLEGHESWKIPALKRFIPYHVGVYGTTGSGKSWFTRHVLIPAYLNSGFNVLILDWSGTDYVPYFKESENVEILSINDLILDEESILSYFRDKTNNFGKNTNIEEAFDEFIEGWSNKISNLYDDEKSVEELYNQLKESVKLSISNIERKDWYSAAERAMRRVFRRLKPSDLKPLMGKITIEEIFENVSNRKVLLIDMSNALSEAKLGFFLAIARHLYSKMESGQNLNLSIIIDEAPQYAPWSKSSFNDIQRETTEMIKNLAALGRKRMLNLTLIAQGIRGEIGIDASVRRNLNTQFFGRIHPLDAGGEGGAAEWLSPYGITPDAMLQLKQGRFYFSGLMNPSPVPLLITYNPI